MPQKDQKKSIQSNCWNCALHEKGGANAFETCMWWEKPKQIPTKVLDKGCKFWRDEWVQEVIDKFEGELIITTRRSRDAKWKRNLRFKKRKTP